MNEEQLSQSLFYFCEANQLPFISADDLLYGKIVTTSKQKSWLLSYIQVWEALGI
tara:strand:+ start:586 stop:750 length:165 start_codon:yes stop_codon:yes gene_type:complete